MRLVSVAVLCFAALVVGACDRGGAPAREVVVYCSADAPVARPVFEAFEKKTGIKVKAVFDTEATKTTGLVNRLLGEHAAGRHECDVWWSSEALGTIRLARAGVLEKYESASAHAWPGQRSRNGEWYSFVRRLRVIAWNTKFVGTEDRIDGWMSLAQPRFKGRVGMARPQFGTTRGHMAAMHAVDDGKMLRQWLEAMVANDIRLYDGNAGVAKAIATGELYVGLTDSDDAINGIRQGWPLAILPVDELGKSAREPNLTHPGRLNVGTMQIPNTVGIVSGSGSKESSRALVDYLLSDDAARLLATGEACALTYPETEVPELSTQFGFFREGERVAGGQSNMVSLWPMDVDFERLMDHVDAAMKVCDEVLKGR